MRAAPHVDNCIRGIRWVGFGPISAILVRTPNVVNVRRTSLLELVAL